MADRLTFPEKGAQFFSLYKRVLVNALTTVEILAHQFGDMNEGVIREYNIGAQTVSPYIENMTPVVTIDGNLTPPTQNADYALVSTSLFFVNSVFFEIRQSSKVSVKFTNANAATNVYCFVRMNGWYYQSPRL